MIFASKREMERALLMMKQGDEGSLMEYVREETQINKGKWLYFVGGSVTNFKSY